MANKFKFQGQEHVDDLGLNWDSFKWRNHQPEIGRFFNIDPLSEKYVHNSPYAFSENKVINGRELEGLEWVNSTGQQVYNPKANGGKGAYTDHATRNDRTLGNSLQQTETGKEQFGKLVNTNQKTTVILNDGPAVKDDKGYVLGKTHNEGETEIDFANKKYNVDVKESTITINLGSVDAIVKDEKKADQQIGGVVLTKGMSFTDILGVVFGHEIEHTTDKNATLDANGKDKEGPAYKVSDKMLNELKDKEKKKE